MRTVMALSGGMDSTSLLLHLLTQNCKITCISFNYGQKHVIEIEKAKANIRYLNELNFQIEHIVIDIIDCMNSLYSALTDSEVDVPEGHYEEEQMKKTVVPNRNAIFSSILYAHALSIATKDDIDVQIALGVHSVIMPYIRIADLIFTRPFTTLFPSATGKAKGYRSSFHT